MLEAEVSAESNQMPHPPISVGAKTPFFVIGISIQMN
jgi:hypothetical protein